MIRAFKLIARLQEDLTELQAQIESEAGTRNKLDWLDKANTAVHELALDLASNIAENGFGNRTSIREYAEVLLHLVERDPSDVRSTLSVKMCHAIIKCDDTSKISEALGNNKFG